MSESDNLLTSNLENRKKLILSLRRELVGPDPLGPEEDCGRPKIFCADGGDARKSRVQKGSGEEILTSQRPATRYGVGVLYPAAEQDEGRPEPTASQEADLAEGEDVDNPLGAITNEAIEELRDTQERKGAGDADVDDDDFEVSGANARFQSTMGISLLVELRETAKLVVTLPRQVVVRLDRADSGTALSVNGRYRRKEVTFPGKDDRELKLFWWLRQPTSQDGLSVEIDASELRGADRRTVRRMLHELPGANLADMDLRIEVYSRPWDTSANLRLLTVCLVNRSQKKPETAAPKESTTGGDAKPEPSRGTFGTRDEMSLFQSCFTVDVRENGVVDRILPYPRPEAIDAEDEGDNVPAETRHEQQSLELLYKNVQTFAVGHGCAADWDATEGSDRARQVRAECMPLYEIPSMTPDLSIKGPSGPLKLEVLMSDLAGLDDHGDSAAAIDRGDESLETLIAHYKNWIDSVRAVVERFERSGSAHTAAAKRHLQDCLRCEQRMRDGLAFLRSNNEAGARARKAFRLANHALLLQQICSKGPVRHTVWQDGWKVEGEYREPDPLHLPEAQRARVGRWRPFQIAFLLMNLKSTADGTDPDRGTVELIWFPTGGGKTEAYLGLAAFAMFHRRLAHPEDSGTHTLMRYTLRLLTAQQFQRASSLICAMEFLRRRNETELGRARFSIGIWVGTSTTPMTREGAREDLRRLNGRRNAPNPFLLDRCPWCRAEMGPYDGSLPNGQPKARGYEDDGRTVVFTCPDHATGGTGCEFRQGLPIYVIDEDIYESPPTLVIGTVDKFARLAWVPAARTLFGLDGGGTQIHSPPGLIIQDELHLISGPLGSMVGIYETAIEELCTDRRSDEIKFHCRPKIVCSTATIRGYKEQIRSLYGRGSACLFPPPGLDAGDSFFGRYARQPDDRLRQGRMYVGIMGPGLGSMQTTSTRVFSALLQEPLLMAGSEKRLPDQELDRWWTLMVFFNSLRELGGAVTLFQSDIPGRLKGLWRRYGLDRENKNRRYLQRPMELTSRIRNDEVSSSIKRLEQGLGAGPRPVDVCLASNIIEVGIDIDRLTMMSVVGQPKSTSQYIQVTGRVGRQWEICPGMVVVLLNPSKPRDRSHYEKFRSYHERLYAWVEPTSVTPFALPVLERALCGVIASYVRQAGDDDAAKHPEPIPSGLVNELRKILRARVEQVDADERDTAIAEFDRRAQQWEEWLPSQWDGEATNDVTPLLYYAGSYVSERQRQHAWATPNSMRDVDAQCATVITRLYDVQNNGGQPPRPVA